MEIEIKCYACSVGDKVVTVRMGDMLKHNAEHHPNRPFKCDLCLNAFISKVAMVEHKSTDHVKFPCIQCHHDGDALFLAREDFGSYYRAQHEFYTVDCKKCPNRFYSDRMCKEHMRMVHDYPRPIPVIRCINCKTKNYSNIKKRLRQHNSKVHGRNFPYECSFCGNCFRTKKSKDDHEETCPYSC